MARVRNMAGKEVGIVWIWDVDFPVGPGRPNRPDDVQLVQHAINTLSAHYMLKTADGALVGYLKRDGLFGPKTKAAILSYQKAVKDSRRYIKDDGQIGPSSATGWTAEGHAQFSIVYLNRDHRDVWGKMMDEKDFPEPLRTKARTNKTIEG